MAFGYSQWKNGKLRCCRVAAKTAASVLLLVTLEQSTRSVPILLLRQKGETRGISARFEN